MAEAKTSSGYKMNFQLTFTPEGRPSLTTDGSKEDNDAGIEALKLAMRLNDTNNGSSFTEDLFTEVRKSNLTLAEAIVNFLNNSINLADSTLKNYRKALNNIAEPYFGPNTLIENIEQKQIAGYATHINSIDRNAQTLEGYAVALTAMGKWVRQQGYAVPPWQIAKMIRKDKRSSRSLRDAFNKSELQAIVNNAATYREKEAAKFWITLLPMLTGMRIEEVCQLNLNTDLIFKDGSHYFTVNAQDDSDGAARKAIKTAAGERIVPIHPLLVKLGLIDYLNTQKTRGFRRPFEAQWTPLVKKRKQPKWSVLPSKWGGRELAKLKKANLIGSGKHTYFHSMRHTFNTHLAHSGLPEEQRAMILGQTFGGINSGTYNKQAQDPVFLESLILEPINSLVDLPID